uniref:Uncharacterized protein MANES_16G052800 n=1 Tax=Rhizophora mucronata TaxID=61149 RepID=A0A2P2MGQ7_RHIMU
MSLKVRRRSEITFSASYPISSSTAAVSVQSPAWSGLADPQRSCISRHSLRSTVTCFPRSTISFCAKLYSRSCLLKATCSSCIVFSKLACSEIECCNFWLMREYDSTILSYSALSSKIIPAFSSSSHKTRCSTASDSFLPNCSCRRASTASWYFAYILPRLQPSRRREAANAVPETPTGILGTSVLLSSMLPSVHLSVEKLPI